MTAAWMRTFPRAPTTANFAAARALHRGPSSSDAATDLAAWLAAMPAGADLSFTALCVRVWSLVGRH